MNTTKLLLLIATITVYFHSTSAHSYLTHPKPRSSASSGCRVGGEPRLQCSGPCENFSGLRKARTYDDRTIVDTWVRGTKTIVRWARNNHKHGFVSLALVPKDKMWDRQAHKDYTFTYVCWDATEKKCDSKHSCGTDRGDIMIEETIEVPTHIPDGEYVLGWTWFGGTMGNIVDYYSCAHIRIRGGRKTDTYTRTSKTCTATTFELGQCASAPCSKIEDPTRGKPRNFVEGSLVKRYDGGNNPMNDPPPPPPMNDPPPPMNDPPPPMNDPPPPMNVNNRAPGVVQAQNFRRFMDLSRGNEGMSQCAPFNTGTGRLVDLQPTLDNNGGCNIGWVEEGEWVEYEVFFTESMDYDIAVRVAAEENDKSLEIEINGRVKKFEFDSTGGWQEFKNVRESFGRINQGTRRVRVRFTSTDLNLNYINFIRSEGNNNDDDNNNNCPQGKRSIHIDASGATILSQPSKLQKGSNQVVQVGYYASEPSSVVVSLNKNFNTVSTGFSLVEVGEGQTNVTINVPSTIESGLGYYLSTQMYAMSTWKNINAGTESILVTEE